MTALLIIVVILVVLALMGVGVYNGLIKDRMGIKEAWSQIDVQLKRRNDLIPNLLSTVQGYAKYEKSTFEEVTKARAAISSGNLSPEDTMKASDTITQGVSRIIATSEAYPELKANAQFQDLMNQLTNTEDKIAMSRQLYNSATGNYNAKIQLFPTNLFAGMLGFKQEAFLATPEAEKETPKVSFDDLGNV
jgi:LemA protein